MLVTYTGCPNECDGDDPCSNPECHLECCGSTDCCSLDPCGNPALCPDQCCRIDPCGNPALCPDQCPTAGSTLDTSRISFPDGDDWEPETDPDGSTVYRGSGNLVINTGCGDPLVLPMLSGEVNFGPDGIFRGLTGELNVENDRCIPGNILANSGASVAIDLFWHPGQFVADNYDIGFEIDPDNQFFVMGLRSDASFGFCNPLTATILEEPRFTVSVGQVLQLLDPCDPMAYTDVGLIGVGRQAQGSSRNGQLKFVPALPQLGEIEEINGQSIQYGQFSYKEFLEVEGMLIRAQPWSLDIQEESLLESELSVGYEAGINATGSISMVLFSVPFAEGSASFKVLAGSEGSYVRMFIRTLAAPYDSWWPDFLPLKPVSEREISGFYVSDQDALQLSLRDRYGLELRINGDTQEYTAEGMGQITQQDFSLTGTVVANDREWQVRSVSTLEKTELTVPFPQNFIDNYAAALCDFAQDEINEANDYYLNTYLPDSTAYVLALDLDGLRSQIPVITSNAREIINDAIDRARNSCQNALPDIVCSGGNLCNLPNPCNTYINQRVMPVVNQFRAILDDLDEAVAGDLSDDQARQAIKDALRALLDRRTIRFNSLEINFCTRPALVCANFGTTRNIAARTRDIFTNAQEALLQDAYENIDRIPSEPFPATEAIYADILAALGSVPDACDGGTVTDLGAVSMGYEWTHAALSARFFYDKADGSRVFVGDFNPFDPLSFALVTQ